MARDTPVRVGVIAGAHGIKGEVKLLSFTAEPAAIASY
ncbi:MAG: ribosome maturation factor RimM, partial [Rhizobiales bacterium]|nr:ribosome maturation factor RimM [Hyphomicrobiales bacterium]